MFNARPHPGPLQERGDHSPSQRMLRDWNCRMVARKSESSRLLFPTHEPFVPPPGFGLCQSSGAFDYPRVPKRQRTGAVQDADASKFGLLRFRGANREGERNH